jgi:hypothetical protein
MKCTRRSKQLLELANVSSLQVDAAQIGRNGGHTKVTTFTTFTAYGDSNCRRGKPTINQRTY